MNKKNWLPFEEARKIVRGKGFKNRCEFQKSWKLGLLPDNIPYDPVQTYKDEWIDLYDWLGKEKTKSLKITHPDIFNQINLSKLDENININDLTAGSNRKIPFECNDCANVWFATLHDRTREDSTGCPYCTNKIIYINNCLATTHPNLVKEWHPTKNGNLTPYDVGPGSHKKVWWIDDKGHEWQAVIYSRTIGNPKGCPFCKNKKVCLDNCLATTHPEIAKEWHSTKNNTTPYDITAGCSIKFWWYREECGHEWYASPNNRTKKTKPTGCPQCAALANKGSNNHNWNPNRDEINLAQSISRRGRGLVKTCLTTINLNVQKRAEEYLGFTKKDIYDLNPKLILIITGWHLDHIFPVKAFIEHGIDDLKIINALSNLQSLPAKENLKKGAKYIKQDFYTYLRNLYGEDFMKSVPNLI